MIAALLATFCAVPVLAPEAVATKPEEKRSLTMTEIGLFSFGETSEVRACALAPVVSYTGKPKKGDTLHAALLRVLPGEERKLVGLGEAALKPSPAAVLMFVPPGSLTENKYVLLSVIGLKDGTAIEHDKKAFGLSGGCPAFSKESLFSEEIS